MKLQWTFIILSASLAQGSPYEYVASSPPMPIPAVPALTSPNVSITAPQPMTVSTEMATSISPATTIVLPELSSLAEASIDAYVANPPPKAQSTDASIAPVTSSPMATAMASSSMPAKPMPSDPMPIEPIPTLPPMIAVDPVPSVPPMPVEPMPSSPAPTVPVPAPPALATTSNLPDQTLVVIEFVPILMQPTNIPQDSASDCEESLEETLEPESCTDAVDVPLFQTSSIPMPSAPAPSVPAPSVPVPSAPMPVEPAPSAPMPVEPMPLTSSQAPLLPPMVTPVYQATLDVESSVSPSDEAPITITDIEVISDDTATDYPTIPYCDDEILPPYLATEPTDAPMASLPMPTNVPAVPAPTPMPTDVPVVPAPAPAPMPTTVPAVPAPAPVVYSDIDSDSESESGATCTPEFVTVTIYEDVPIEPVTVTEYLPYFVPIDTNMWTLLLPTPPLAPGPVIWTGTPPPLITDVPNTGQPAIPAPSSTPAAPVAPVAPCSTSSWIRV
ncbi:hypothetical protein GGF42_003650 [Coemansia sp. RSA 2424]|nr:hypothetical protein GGF42_003650 [Coemansia sp. RSA 2424]